MSSHSVSVRATGQGVACKASKRGWTFTFDPDEESSPRAIEYLLFSLGACTAATVGRYMRQHGFPTDDLEVVVSADFDESSRGYKAIKVCLRPGRDFSENDQLAFLAVARDCRIHNTLEHLAGVQVEIPGLASV